MNKISGELTVFFESPFWIGVFERVSNDKLSVSKVTFGAEPKDYEIWDFVLTDYYALKFSPAVETEAKKTADNPKRKQRNARKQLRISGIGTKSQLAMQIQREKTSIQVEATKTKRKAQRALTII